MGKVTKRKIRIKKKNFAIFITFIMIFVFAITQVFFLVYKLITTSHKKEEPEIELKEKKNENKKEENKKEEKKKEEKKLTETERKLNKLNNIDKKIDYFNNDYIDRYISYKANNKNLSDEQIIKNVNMQLDKVKYEDTIPAKNLNTLNILVNKYYYLSKDYKPENLEKISTKYALSGMKLVKEAKEAFEKMASAAEKEDLKIVAMSTYRSYDYQVDLYNRYKKKDGEEAADTYSGRAGHSEHQTGLAVDVYDNELDYTSFEKTNEFKWMEKHAQEYGFILRFPKDKEEETGYHYESWHYRYVGIETAKYIKEHNISFEEYYATKIKDW